MIDVSVKQIKGASPLRYPGGKSALTGFLADIIDGLEFDSPTYVEPYAGGAGAALALLDSGAVEKIVINDFDPAIFAFWHALVNHNAEFLEIFDETEVTLEQWAHQKQVYRESDLSDVVSLGFATYFLNRTNRSGVLNAGVIGGKKQEGTYKVDARFTKHSLRPRLEWVGKVASKIDVTRLDGLDCLMNHLNRPNTFVYADPPYFEKGSLLYLNAFRQRDHEDLAQLLNQNIEAAWLLSYDNIAEIRDMYSERFQQTFQLNYSAHRSGKARELLVASPTVVNCLFDRALSG